MKNNDLAQQLEPAMTRGLDVEIKFLAEECSFAIDTFHR